MKKSKTGFTLVELLAVIVILAIILAIAIPSITGIISSTTKTAFESDAKLVLKGIDYKVLEDDTFDITTINETNVESILSVDDANYESVMVMSVSGVPNVVIVGKGKWDGLTAHGSYSSMTVEDSDTYLSGRPVITITGDNPATVAVDAVYSDVGATAADDEDGNLTGSIVVTNNVDTSTAGTYTVIYNVTDSDSNKAVQAIRIVTVQ